jgi:hypothetical protein
MREFLNRAGFIACGRVEGNVFDIIVLNNRY